MAAVKELLLETLSDLTNEELKNFKWFLQFRFFQRSLQHILWGQLWEANGAGQLVDVMVELCGQQSVEVSMEVFMDMNRTDLVQRLSETSSEFKGVAAVGSSAEAFGVKTMEGEKHQDKPLQKEVTMISLQEKVSEILEDLSYGEFKQFKGLLPLSRISRDQVDIADRAEIVELMTETYGQQSLEVTREVLERMNRKDLVQSLSEVSSGLRVKPSVDEHQLALVEREVTMISLQEKVSEILEDLSFGDLEKFKRVLQYSKMKEGLPRIPRHRMEMADRVEIVELMVELYGPQSVEVTREVKMKLNLIKMMNRRDLVHRLPNISSGSKEKYCVNEHLSALMQKTATITTDREKLLKNLGHLKLEELKKLKWFLQDSDLLASLPCIPTSRLEKGDVLDLVDLMLQTYSQHSMDVTKKVFKKINRNDLV